VERVPAEVKLRLGFCGFAEHADPSRCTFNSDEFDPDGSMKDLEPF